MKDNSLDVERIMVGLRKKVKTVTERVAWEAQEALHDVAHPIWTGLYRSGWTVGINYMPSMEELPPTQYRDAMSLWIGPCQSAPPIYPEFDSEVVNLSSPFATVYIANIYPHAAMIEHEGSPCSYEPWKVAASARDVVLRNRNRGAAQHGQSFAAKFAQGGHFARDAAAHELALGDDD